MKRIIVIFVLICATVSMWAQTEKELETVRSQANMGNSEAIFMLGTYYLQNGNNEEALKWIRKSAEEKGFAPAQWILGGLYMQGIGVNQNNTEAFKWFSKSAKQDFAMAQFSVGAFYYGGIGVEKDWTQALYWCEKALANYKKASKEEQAFYTQNGFDVTQLESTIAEIKAGDSSSSDSSTSNSSSSSASATPDGSKSNTQAQIDEYLAKAKATKDKTEMSYWYEKAAELGNIVGQTVLAAHFMTGYGVPKDENTALYWYEQQIKNKDFYGDREKIEERIRELKSQGFTAIRTKTVAKPSTQPAQSTSTQNEKQIIVSSIIDKSQKYAKITDEGNVYSSINQLQTYNWDNLENIRIYAGKKEWKTQNFTPSNGMIGEVVGKFPHGSTSGLIVYILKIQNKFYVPIENSGIKFISETEYNILATSGSTASRNTGAHPAEPEMVFVKGGSFLMGCTSEQDNCDEDERPAHHVTVSDFYIGKYEVTQAQWEQLMGTNIRQQRDKFQRRANIFGEGSNYPMYYVSWDEAQMFIERLNAATGKRYRLPTEAEWEYAARGGNKSKGYKYAGSNSLENVAWFYDNSGRSTHPIGTKMANELGIYDMSGNVREWCYDWYGLYSSNSQTNPTGAGSGSSRVSRGGGLFHNAQKCRVACRDKLPSIRYDNLGFRLVLSSEQKESATSGSTGMAQGQVFEFEVPNKNNLVMIMAEARHVFQFDFNDNKLIHKHIAFPSDSKIIDTLDTFTIFAIAPRNETTPVFSISFGIQKGTNKYSCLFFDTLQVTDKMPAFMGIFPFNSQGNNIDFDNGNEYHLGSDDYKFINAEQFKKLQEYVDKRKQSKSQSTTPTSSTAPSATSKPQSSAASSASYLTTDGTNFTFDSDGINGLPITVSTDGSSWEVSLLPSWCSVKDKTGNSFRLVVNPNSGAARSDWFKVKSGNKEVRIEVKQTAGKQTTGTKGTSAQIENIWVDHNFSCGYNRKCLKIHIKFTVNGMLHKQGHCNAYFSFQNGNKLIDSNRQYRATDGQVSVGESFKPSHESAVFNDFALVIPHDEFHLGRGSYYLKFYVCIFDNNGNQIATSNYVDFTYNY